jgi:hypothetical protein
VSRGDKKQALYHYDIALRTKPTSFPLLLPTLVGALDDPEVRSGLVPYVKAAPNWLPTFLGEAIATAKNPVHIADVLLKAGRLPDRDEYDGLPNALLMKLATKTQFPVFRRYYLSLSGSQAATLQSVELKKLNLNLPYPAAGWQLVDHPAIGGAFSAFDRSGRSQLSAFAGSGERGELMRKYLLLKPADYQFSVTYEAAEAAPDSEIRWEMQCLSAAENTSKWVTAGPVRKGRSTASQIFSLGSECPYQLLTLHLAGGSSQLGMEFTLRDIDIKVR